MTPTLEEFNRKFNEITNKWLSGIDFRGVEFTENEILQAGDDFQSEAFEDLGGESSEICEWEFYDESCDARGYFQQLLAEKWNEEIQRRGPNNETF